jgi:hypothetical protein
MQAGFVRASSYICVQSPSLNGSNHPICKHCQHVTRKKSWGMIKPETVGYLRGFTVYFGNQHKLTEQRMHRHILTVKSKVP